MLKFWLFLPSRKLGQVSSSVTGIVVPIGLGKIHLKLNIFGKKGMELKFDSLEALSREIMGLLHEAR